MERRGFLKILSAGPAIATLPWLGEAAQLPDVDLADFARNGFPDVEKLPRLQLINHTSRLAEEHRAPAGQWCLVYPNRERVRFDLLGPVVNLKRIDDRPMAAWFGKDRCMRFYDLRSHQFQQIVEKCYPRNRYYQCGFEVFFIVNQKTLAYLTCTSMTLKDFAIEMMCISKPVDVGSRLACAGRFHWYAPRINL